MPKSIPTAILLLLMCLALSELLMLAVMTQVQLEDIERKLARIPTGMIVTGEAE